MSFLTAELDLAYIDGVKWRLITELLWASFDGQRRVRVPAGFVTDFASVPKVFWNVLPPTGSYGKAAVLHDYMYQTGQWTPEGPSCSRSDADSVLRAAMDDLGVGWWTKWTIYSAVRVGGGSIWAGYRGSK